MSEPIPSHHEQAIPSQDPDAHQIRKAVDMPVDAPLGLWKDEEESRWDLDKARAVTAASELVTSKSVEEQNDLPDATLLGIPTSAIEENRRFHEIEELLSQKGLDEKERERLQEELYAMYESQGNYANRTLNAEHFSKIIDRKTATPEVLYDSNPERFAHMPTAEFIEMVKTYDTLKSRAEQYEKARFKVDELVQQTQAAIAGRRSLLGDYINSYEELLKKRLIDQDDSFGEYVQSADRNARRRIEYMNDEEFREYFGQLIPEPIDYFEDSKHTQLVKFQQAVMKVREIFLHPHAEAVPRYHRFLEEQGLPGVAAPEAD